MTNLVIILALCAIAVVNGASMRREINMIDNKPNRNQMSQSSTTEISVSPMAHEDVQFQSNRMDKTKKREESQHGQFQSSPFPTEDRFVTGSPATKDQSFNTDDTLYQSQQRNMPSTMATVEARQQDRISKFAAQQQFFAEGRQPGSHPFVAEGHQGRNQQEFFTEGYQLTNQQQYFPEEDHESNMPRYQPSGSQRFLPDGHHPSNQQRFQPDGHQPSGQQMFHPEGHQQSNQEMFHPDGHQQSDEQMFPPNRDQSYNQQMFHPNRDHSSTQQMFPPTRDQSSNKQMFPLNRDSMFHPSRDQSSNQQMFHPNRDQPSNEQMFHPNRDQSSNQQMFHPNRDQSSNQQMFHPEGSQHSGRRQFFEQRPIVDFNDERVRNQKGFQSIPAGKKQSFQATESTKIHTRGVSGSKIQLSAFDNRGHPIVLPGLSHSGSASVFTSGLKNLPSLPALVYNSGNLPAAHTLTPITSLTPAYALTSASLTPARTMTSTSALTTTSLAPARSLTSATAVTSTSALTPAHGVPYGQGSWYQGGASVRQHLQTPYVRYVYSHLL